MFFHFDTSTYTWRLLSSEQFGQHRRTPTLMRAYSIAWDSTNRSAGNQSKANAAIALFNLRHLLYFCTIIHTFVGHPPIRSLIIML